MKKYEDLLYYYYFIEREDLSLWHFLWLKHRVAHAPGVTFTHRTSRGVGSIGGKTWTFCFLSEVKYKS